MINKVETKRFATLLCQYRDSLSFSLLEHLMAKKYPSGYYVYAYLRSDGTPYYIGKGIRERAWKHGNNEPIKTPPDHNRIIILESNLSNIGACAIERRMIRWYGRKEVDGGILRNRTSGGDGFGSGNDNYVISNGLIGEKNSWYENKNPNYDPNKYELQNVSTGEIVWKTKKQMREEYGVEVRWVLDGKYSHKGWGIVGFKPIDRTLSHNNANYNSEKYEWENISSGDIVKMTCREMIETYSLSVSGVTQVKNGNYKSTGGWKLHGTDHNEKINSNRFKKKK